MSVQSMKSYFAQEMYKISDVLFLSIVWCEVKEYVAK
jgi:hypothetical protein